MGNIISKRLSPADLSKFADPTGWQIESCNALHNAEHHCFGELCTKHKKHQAWHWRKDTTAQAIKQLVEHYYDGKWGSGRLYQEWVVSDVRLILDIRFLDRIMVNVYCRQIPVECEKNSSEFLAVRFFISEDGQDEFLGERGLFGATSRPGMSPESTGRIG